MIHRYLSGVLSHKDKEGFEEHLFNCDTCFEEIQLREETTKLIKEERHVLFADYLETRKAEVKEGVYYPHLGEKLVNLIWKKQRKWAFSALAVAAVAVILVTVNNPFSHSPMTKLYETEPFPFAKPRVLSGAGESHKLFYQAMGFYQERDYQQASVKLEAVVILDPELSDGRFFLGLSYLFQRRLDDAILNLEIAKDLNPESEKEHWYLGHAYLEKGDRRNAAKQFQMVRNLGQPLYAQRAERFLEQLTMSEPDKKRR